jgi:PleD family two-component response regulator
LSRRGRAVCFTVSAGVADLGLADHPRSALDRADEALYSAKRGGRDRVTVWSAYSTDERREQQR